VFPVITPVIPIDRHSTGEDCQREIKTCFSVHAANYPREIEFWEAVKPSRENLRAGFYVGIENDDQFVSGSCFRFVAEILEITFDCARADFHGVRDLFGKFTVPDVLRHFAFARSQLELFFRV